MNGGPELLDGQGVLILHLSKPAIPPSDRPLSLV